jgi:hypothetical protein
MIHQHGEERKWLNLQMLRREQYLLLDGDKLFTLFLPLFLPFFWLGGGIVMVVIIRDNFIIFIPACK